METSPLVHEVREASGPPDGALLLLHGRGADQHDLVPLFDVLDPERRLVGLAPGGPLALPPGGRHWYVVPRVGYPDPRTFAATLRQLEAFLDGWLAQRGVPWDRTVIGGFSMGAVMSYAVALGPARPAPAGVLAMSGFIPTVEGWQPDLPGRRDLPVAITHGRADPVIGVDFARRARERLDEAGLAVTYLETDVAHQIDPTVVGDLVAWVGERVPSALAP
jgi:phospholipase/carboxylesterase